MSSIYQIDSGSDSDHESLSCSGFNPSACLFCSHRAANFDNNQRHMRLKHGFTIPDPEHLVADAETLVQYLHLVIAQDHECLLCGSARRSPTAVQHHMRGKNHCRLDLSDPASEFRDFYDIPAAHPIAAAPETRHGQLQPVVVAGMEMWLTSSAKMLHHRDHPKKAHKKAKHHMPLPVKARDRNPRRLAAGARRSLIHRTMSDQQTSKRGAKMHCLQQFLVAYMRAVERAVFERMSSHKQHRVLRAHVRDLKLMTRQLGKRDSLQNNPPRNR